jgi:hypothetical protein
MDNKRPVLKDWRTPMSHRHVLTCLVVLASAAIMCPAFAQDAEPIPTESGSVVEDPNAAAPTLDLSKYVVEVTRMGAMLNIQYKADDYDAMGALQKLAAPSIEIYKGDLLLTSGTLEFG